LELHLPFRFCRRKKEFLKLLRIETQRNLLLLLINITEKLASFKLAAFEFADDLEGLEVVVVEKVSFFFSPF
jgi:predicted site-specific integrase-resolvase